MKGKAEAQALRERMIDYFSMHETPGIGAEVGQYYLRRRERAHQLYLKMAEHARRQKRESAY